MAGVPPARCQYRVGDDHDSNIAARAFFIDCEFPPERQSRVKE